MTTTTKLDPDAIYLGENGRAFCGTHAGATAAYTGRDLDGRPVHRVTPRDVCDGQEIGVTFRCETCGREPQG